MCWLDVGLGKTIVSLSAFALLQDMGVSLCLLVVAPLRVAQSVWMQEAAKWAHTQHLRVSLVLGDARERQYALSRRADIYVINPDNLVWLMGHAKQHWKKTGPPWSAVVMDEVTLFKTSSAKRTQALIALTSVASRRIGLTGEPAANGYPDLFGQFRVVDGGKRLGEHVTEFRRAYLQQGFRGYGWTCSKPNQERIRNRIKDITLEQSAMECLGLPPVRRIEVWVDLPPEARAVYDKMEHDAFAELPGGGQIEATHAASIVGKLAQIASGAAYLERNSSEWREIHAEKLNALDDIIEEAGGRPILVGHTYIHERERILARYKNAKAIDSDVNPSEFETRLTQWKHDQIPVLVIHPRSAGHGLNLQGGSARATVWFGLPWSLELRNQLEGRLFGGHRRQGEGVIIEILARGTVDEAIKGALATKDGVQTGLKRAIQEYRERKGL